MIIIRASYHRLPICDARLVREKQEQFFTVYTFTTELEAYRREVQHLAMQYSRYIRWKTEGDDAVLAEEMTGYPAREMRSTLKVWKNRNRCGLR